MGRELRRPALKAILFDFGQTLVDSADGFRAAEKQVQGKILADLGAVRKEGFLRRYRKLRGRFHASSGLSRAALWKEVYETYARQPDPKRLAQWEREYWQEVRARTHLLREAAGVLQELKARYRMGLVTNSEGSGARQRVSQFPDLKGCFEAIVVAGESGIAPKPDPAPFLLCLERLGVEPCQAVYVGDDWLIDICGAERAGLQPIWLQHHETKRNWPSVKTPVPVITSLTRLLDLVDG